jgi:olfactory receptor
MISDSVFIAVSYVFILKTVLGIVSHRELFKALRQCVFFAVSYVFILKAVLGTASHRELFKGLNTYVFHICAVLISYVPNSLWVPCITLLIRNSL